MVYKYQQSILGGTFDRFHIGHKKLIDEAFKQSEKVIIGISTNKLIKNKLLSNTIEDYKTREDYLKEYLKNKDYLKRSIIIPINDIYGNSLAEKNIQALFCTTATLFNAKKLNIKRKEIDFLPLKIITIPFIKDNEGKTITSERIRYGEIDREGNVYLEVFKNKDILKLPEDLREDLRKPVGIVIKDIEKIRQFIKKNKPPIIIAIGDIVSIHLAKINFKADISIVDFKTRRKPVNKEEVLKLLSINSKSYTNNPGTINIKSVNALNNAIKKYLKTGEKQTVVINGEEDLLALPAILLSPLNSIVLYGQYDLGTIVVEVTEEKKKLAEELLKKFQ